MVNTATSHNAWASQGIQTLLDVRYNHENTIPPINSPKEHRKFPNGEINSDSAMVWCRVKISAETIIGSQNPPITCSNFVSINHLNKYSSKTELTKIQNITAQKNVTGLVKPTGSSIAVKSLDEIIKSPRKK